MNKLAVKPCHSISSSVTVLKHRALHVRHNQLPLSREEEEARVINCETTFRNRFEDLRRRFDLVRFTFNRFSHG